MNPDTSSGRTWGFTMVELLTVIAIIAILAALLLPVLDKSEMRGKRVWCIDNLSQAGLAFHTFANDHGGKFPMAVSTNDGGSMEYVESGFDSGPIFYTAYHHFQALSNELVFPRILLCPTDVQRVAATNFPSLQNQNLSYFVGVNATFDKPESILAGDRNLLTNAWSQPTILGYSSASLLSWTWEMHQHQGNMLFSDGHVDQWNDASFGAGENNVPGTQNFFMPSVPPVTISFANGPQNSGSGSSSDSGNGSSSGSGNGPGNGSGGYGNSVSAGPSPYSGNSSPMARQNSSPPNSGQPSASYHANNQLGSRELDSEGGSPSATSNNPTVVSQANSDVAVGADSDSGMSDWNRKLTRTLQHITEWGFFWLWLLALLYLAYRYWKWQRKRAAKLRAEMARRIPAQVYADHEDSTE